jgi:hypothetical protein
MNELQVPSPRLMVQHEIAGSKREGWIRRGNGKPGNRIGGGEAFGLWDRIRQAIAKVMVPAIESVFTGGRVTNQADLSSCDADV